MEKLIRRSDAIKAMAKAVGHIVYDAEAVSQHVMNSIPAVEPKRGEVNAVKEYEDAIFQLEHNKINLGEYESLIEPLKHLYAVEPKHGEWIRHDEERDYCSVCKHIFKTRTLTNQDKWTTYVDDLGYNFCPNCGAKMKGE